MSLSGFFCRNRRIPAAFLSGVRGVSGWCSGAHKGAGDRGGTDSRAEIFRFLSGPELFVSGVFGRM